MSAPAITLHRVGHSQEPLVVVDDFHPDPARLRAFAIAQGFGAARDYYPGLRAPLPDDYFALVGATISAILHRAFEATTYCRLLDASFSIVTRAPGELTLSQRLPHVDAVDQRRFALVHYLTPGASDGTSFYRHRATGIERLREAQVAAFYDVLDAELRRVGEPDSYVNGSTALFERIAHVDGRFNRAVLYRSSAFHSGAIAADAALSADPALGRLTVTGFLAVDPPARDDPPGAAPG